MTCDVLMERYLTLFYAVKANVSAVCTSKLEAVFLHDDEERGPKDASLSDTMQHSEALDAASELTPGIITASKSGVHCDHSRHSQIAVLGRESNSLAKSMNTA